MKNAVLKFFFALVIIGNIAFFGFISDVIGSVYSLLMSLLDFDLMAIIFAVLTFGLLVAFLVYFVQHKEKGEIVATVEFESPDNMTPAEVGFLIDGIVDGEDISALLVYWAGKKYVEIVGNKKNQKLIKLVDNLPDEARNYEKLLYAKIFADEKEVLVKDVTKKLSGDQTVQKAAKEIEDNVGKKCFNSKTISHRQFFVCLIAVIFYLALSYFGYFLYPIFQIIATIFTALFIGCADWVLNYYDYRHKNNAFKGRLVSFICFLILMGVIGAGCFIVFMFFALYLEAFVMLGIAIVMLFLVLLSRKIEIYSKEGQEKLGKIIGFKNFIDTAEADRIKALVEKNPNFYYDVLPYAYVLGVSDKWIKNLDIVKDYCPNVVDKKMISGIVVWSILLATTSVGLLQIVSIAQGVTKSLFGRKKKKTNKS